MKIKIKVTKDVLRKSTYCGTSKTKFELISTNCAVAIAVKDIFKQACVSNDEITIFGLPNGARETIQLPAIAKAFIQRFDSLIKRPKDRLLLEPIEFDIDIPSTIIDRISLGRPRKIRNFGGGGMKKETKTYKLWL